MIKPSKNKTIKNIIIFHFLPKRCCNILLISLSLFFDLYATATSFISLFEELAVNGKEADNVSIVFDIYLYKNKTF